MRRFRLREHAQARRTGFALPAVLAVTGVVTLIFLVAITALSSLTAEAASARARVRFLQRAMTAEATLAYMAATEPLGTRGLNVGAPRSFDEFSAEQAAQIAARGPVSSALPVTSVALDGPAYTISDPLGELRVTMRDQAGMINLARLDDDQTRRLAEAVGIPPNVAREIRPRFQDYVDTDDLRRPNGAERADYGRSGGPADRPLLRPSEWLSLLDVRAAVEARRWRAMRDSLAVDQTLPTLNVNTMDAATMQVLFGVDRQQAEAAIADRDRQPFLTLSDFLAASGAAAAEDLEQIYTFPSGRILFVISDTRSAWTYRGRITLTPFGLEQPLWIDQTELTEAPRRAVADSSDATRLPYAPR